MFGAFITPSLIQTPLDRFKPIFTTPIKPTENVRPPKPFAHKFPPINLPGGGIVIDDPIIDQLQAPIFENPATQGEPSIQDLMVEMARKKYGNRKSNQSQILPSITRFLSFLPKPFNNPIMLIGIVLAVIILFVLARSFF